MAQVAFLRDFANISTSSSILPTSWTTTTTVRSAETVDSDEPWTGRPASIAIIGAGAGGASTSFYLSELCPSSDSLLKEPSDGGGGGGGKLDMTLYEAGPYVGGRSTVVTMMGDREIEVGASIFVDVNMNLMQASKLFNLTLTPHSTIKQEQDARDGSFGIWDGEEMVYSDFSTSRPASFAKLIWRYGFLGPLRAKSHVKSCLSKFLKIYSLPAFRSITELASQLDLLPLLNSTGWESFTDSTSSQEATSLPSYKNKFLSEVVSAATRVNYAQELTSLHGLMSAVSFVTEAETYSIQGGNRQIFAKMAESSGATLSLNTTVSSISRTPPIDGRRMNRGNWRVCHDTAEDVRGSVCRDFDQVVLAAPHTLSTIRFDPPLSLLPVEYVTLHVTLVASKTARLAGSYFGGSSSRHHRRRGVPQTVLTNSPRAEFQSISVVDAVNGTFIYKIFSLTRVSQDLLDRLFAAPGGGDGGGGESSETKAEFEETYRHEWQAYPRGLPTTQFDEVEIMDGLYYLNGIERFISTMETATIAGKNVARLLAQRLGC